MNWGYTLIRAYRRCVGLRPFAAELITVGRYLYHGNKPTSAQSRAICVIDHASFRQRAAHQRAYIDGVDIFIILTKALKYVNPLYFLESTSYKNEQSLASNMASAGKTVAIDQQLARLICSSDVSACA